MDTYRRNKTKYIQLKTILTVPHSVCFIVDSIRTCDRVAKKFATLLNGELTKLGVATNLIESRQSRYQIDDNRFAGYFANTPLWADLKKELATKTGRFVVLDIHSFPVGAFNQNEPLKNKDVVILANIPFNKLSEVVADSVGATILPARPLYNSIIDMMEFESVPATLIEINEAISDNKMLEYVKKIANAVFKFYG